MGKKKEEILKVHNFRFACKEFDSTKKVSEEDLINAGAQYVDEEVLIDGNLITSRTLKDLPAFVKAVIEKIG